LQRIGLRAGDAVTADKTLLAAIEPGDPALLDDRSRAVGEFERSLTVYARVAIQTAGLAIAAQISGDEARARVLLPQAAFLFWQLPGHARVAAGLLRAAFVTEDEPDPVLTLRDIAEKALLRPEARAILGEVSHARVAAALSEAFAAPAVPLESCVSGSEQTAPSPHTGAAAPDRSPVPASPPSSTLSRRERQVVCLIVEGMTNRQIGARLGVKGVTINTFVTRIFGKLGVENRAAAAASAVRNALCGV
jgi:DNA-binding CsgD family transcriptional regulator